MSQLARRVKLFNRCKTDEQRHHFMGKVFDSLVSQLRDDNSKIHILEAQWVQLVTTVHFSRAGIFKETTVYQEIPAELKLMSPVNESEQAGMNALEGSGQALSILP